MPRGGSARLRAGIRPEYVRLRPPGADGAVPAKLLRQVITIGGQHLLTLAVGQTRLKAKVAPDQGAALQAELAVECPLDRVMLFRDDVRLPEEPRALAPAGLRLIPPFAGGAGQEGRAR